MTTRLDGLKAALDRLRTLKARVECFGDLGAQVELEAAEKDLRRTLRALRESHSRPVAYLRIA